MKRLIAGLLVLALFCCVAGLAETPSGALEFGIYNINKQGNVVLSVYGNTFAAQGFEYGDVIRVDLGSRSFEMPVGSNYTDVDSGRMICRLVLNEEIEKSAVVLSINGGSFATEIGLADQVEIEADPGYEWRFRDGFDANTTFSVSMAEKGGYALDYALHQLDGSNAREDYPGLTDEQYANFRMIAVGDIAPHTLYRSSSPIDPKLNRNREADAALNDAGVASVINLTDTAKGMTAYEGYGQTFYSQRNLLALALTTDFDTEAFRAGMAKAARFIAGTEGPWLIHCTLGKDRTGFTCAMLECFMGASADEVVEDYMLSYVNFYGLSPDDDKYVLIVEGAIVPALSNALGVADFRADGHDLKALAEGYLAGIGLTESELDALRSRLSGQS